MEDLRFYVYTHSDPITREVRYVGKGTGRRANQINCGRMGKVKNYINDISNLGLKPIVNILIDNLDNEDAFYFEIQAIKTYRALGFNLLNVVEGGCRGPTMHGNKNPFFGRKHTNETKEKMRIANKARPLETRLHGDKNPMFGKRGNLHHNYGKRPSDLCIEMSKKSHIGKTPHNAKSIICNETKIEFSSIKKCSVEMSISSSAIKRHLKGEKSPTGGHSFDYVVKLKKDKIA